MTYYSSSYIRLSALDQQNADARDVLNRERIRGTMIDWLNTSRRLDRCSKNPPTGYDADTVALFLGNTALEAASFQTAHLKTSDPELSEGLRVYEQALAERIYDSAAAFSADITSVDDAITCLARNNALGGVIDYLYSIT